MRMEMYKVISLIIVVMVIFTMLLVPMQEADVFPAWLDADLISIFLVLMMVSVPLLFMRR